MNKTPEPKDFSSFGFSSAILFAIERAGYQKPTDVQIRAIPEIMQGRDVLAGAETGSGKTAAFALPLIDKLLTQKQEEGQYAAKGNHIRALILVPTRELAIQISGEISKFAEGLTPHIDAQSVFGGVKINPQMKELRGGADVLVATPGRLLDLVSKNAVKFNKLKTLILDEVDRLVDEGFKDEIAEVVKLLPNQRQNLMFTATYPDSIRYLIRGLLTKPVIIDLDPSDKVLIDQRAFTVNRENKNALLAYLLEEYDWKQILIFCSAKKTCDNLVMKLEKRGIASVAMHGNKEQRARAKALREFKDGSTRVLVATDVAARGLDIEQLPCVVNFELPRSPKDYIHRIGRTGRAGEKGTVISLIAHHEYAHFSVIERHNDIRLEREQIEGFEADAVAPEPLKKGKPKKKPRKKLSKKKRQKLLDAKNKLESESKLAPLKQEPLSVGEDDDFDAGEEVRQIKAKTERKRQNRSTEQRPPKKFSPYERSKTKAASQTNEKKPIKEKSKKGVNASIWGR